MLGTQKLPDSVPGILRLKGFQATSEMEDRQRSWRAAANFSADQEGAVGRC